jgi:hypothetical protein
MLAEPGEVAVTAPAGETEATSGALLDHSISESETARPSASVTVASRVADAPTRSVIALRATSMVSAGGVRRPVGSSEQERHTKPKRSAREPRWRGEAGAENQAIYSGGYFPPTLQGGDQVVKVAAGSVPEDISGLR